MVAKFAQLLAFSRSAARDARPVAIPCNDNQPIRRPAPPPRIMHRPVLVRRWLIAPSGALECRWFIAADDDPPQSWLASGQSTYRTEALLPAPTLLRYVATSL